jgi:hypothetical protein
MREQKTGTIVHLYEKVMLQIKREQEAGTGLYLPSSKVQHEGTEDRYCMASTITEL